MLTATDTGPNNSFLKTVPRMFWWNGRPHLFGILLVIVPLFILLVLFYLIRKRSKNNKTLKIYAVVALFFYIIYFYWLSKLFALV